MNSISLIKLDAIQQLNDKDEKSGQLNLGNELQTNDDKRNQENKDDSPAKNLRPRRTTTYSTSQQRYSRTNLDQLKQTKLIKFKNSTLSEVKRNLFDDGKPNEQNRKRNQRTSNSPSKSLLENVDLNVFAENLLVDKLTECGKNNINYLCLRIIEIMNEERVCSNSMCVNCFKANDAKLNGNSDESVKCLKNERLVRIYCQQAEALKTNLNVQKPVILLYLFNEYCNFKERLTVGKVLEVVKFEIKRLPDHIQQSKYKQNSSPEIAISPFYIEVKADREKDWISLISLKKNEPITTTNLLNVINTQNKYQAYDNILDQPPTKNPKVIFSSYVVKSESSEQNNQHLQNTKSPTIKRFMKTINKSYAQETNRFRNSYKKA